MASASFSLSIHFFGTKLAADSPPQSVRFRPTRPVSAAYASTTTERRHHIASQSSSLYDVLGIQTGATCREIKTAYRRLARVVHPDVVASNGQKESSADQFMKIHSAYATLSDPQARADYDRTLFMGRRPVSVSSGSGFSCYTSRSWETDQCW